MIKKKLQFQEDNNSSKLEFSFKSISKKNLNNSFDLKESINTNNSTKETEKSSKKQVRGRQLYPNNISAISKKNNSSLATTCESKKRIGNKREIIKKMKNKAFSARMNTHSNDECDSLESFSNSIKRRRKNVKEKKNYCTEINKRSNRNRNSTFPEILNESKELDLSRENNRESSEDLIIYNDNVEDNIHNIDNLTNEIERILIDIYNNHIKADKNRPGIDISKYERHIRETSLGLDKHYNIFILQILSEKIKDLVKRYKEKIFEIPEISVLKKKYHENENSLGTKDSKDSKKIEFKHEKNNREKLLIIKKEQTLQFSEPMWNIMSILLLELTNIKNALINSSGDIEKVFSLPLSHLKLNEKKVTFCIQDMHKEEFYKTLLDDRFISFLIHQIKINAKETKMEEIIKLIENLEYDTFMIKSNKNSNQITQNSDGEMTRFTIFLDHKLKEIIERQNAFELQIQNIKANHNLNGLNNLNNLINLKNNAANFYNPLTNDTKGQNQMYNHNHLHNHNHSLQNISVSNGINNSIIQECSHHMHSHSKSTIVNHNNNPNINSAYNEHFNYSCKNFGTNYTQNVSTTNTNFNILNTSIKTAVVNTNGNSNTNENLNNVSNSKTFTVNSNKNEKFTDIDELVAYINTNNDTNKTKKNKKKLKNTKKKNQLQNKNFQSVINESINDESFIDNFRKNIYNSSSNADNIRKIKPVFSNEWLKSINNIVK